MNPVLEALAGLLLIMLLVMFMLGVSEFEGVLQDHNKRKGDDQSARDKKMLREQTDEEKSDDSGKTGHNRKK